MYDCKPEVWKVDELIAAIEGKDRKDRKIVVPMFQRNRVWTPKQEKTFVDSIINGYPFGSMLFHKRIDNSVLTYVLVDGLQRSNTLKKYISNPLSFVEDKDFSDDECEKILDVLNVEKTPEKIEMVRIELSEFIKKHMKFDDLKYVSLINSIVKKFKIDYSGELFEKLECALTNVFSGKKFLYETVKNTEMPIIIYSGPDFTLPEIFGRINSKGTPLSQYEIYAATWAIEKKFKVNNQEIVKINIQKYKEFNADNFAVDKFSPDEMDKSCELNPFDYLYGLSRYLVENFDNLRINTKAKLNPLGFELVNACLNSDDKISELDKKLLAMKDVNKFEKALINAINFVDDAIKPMTQFKGNKRQSKRMFHSKFQILSMIASVFKEMYIDADYSIQNPNWKKEKADWSTKLLRWYINDIITNYWSDGGTKKIYQVSSNKRYAQSISYDTWNSDLDNYFNKSLQRIEKKASKVASAKSEEYVILNTIYLEKFTLMDNLGLEKFDIEHIAPKEQMARLIAQTNGDGLSISNIANLCYLPEYANRTKHDKTFYQDDKYKDKVDIKEIEAKYSFTKEADLKWIEESSGFEKKDFPKLKETYERYCRNRFVKMKKEFFKALKIKKNNTSF